MPIVRHSVAWWSVIATCKTDEKDHISDSSTVTAKQGVRRNAFDTPASVPATQAFVGVSVVG